MRDWKPLTHKELKAIIADTEKDNPDGDYCAAEIYRLAREVEQMRHLCLAAIGFINGVSCLSKDAITKQLADAARPSLIHPRQSDRLDQPCGDDEDESPHRIFDTCNVCGRRLYTKAEDQMGMCVGCAAE